MTISAHPLQWPVGWKRTAAGHRQVARFSTKARSRTSQQLSIADGVGRVLEELDRMGLSRNDVVISTNVETRLDGLPRSDRSEPGDSGVAVYWQTRKGGNKVMAIDHYTRVADNLAAVAATLEAMRAIERHGGAAILERAFTGFAALPAPSAKQERHWRTVLDLVGTPTPDEVTQAFRRARSPAHAAGAEALGEVKRAYEQALQELGYA